MALFFLFWFCCPCHFLIDVHSEESLPVNITCWYVDVFEPMCRIHVSAPTSSTCHFCKLMFLFTEKFLHRYSCSLSWGSQ